MSGEELEALVVDLAQRVAELEERLPAERADEGLSSLELQHRLARLRQRQEEG